VQVPITFYFTISKCFCLFIVIKVEHLWVFFRLFSSEFLFCLPFQSCPLCTFSRTDKVCCSINYSRKTFYSTDKMEWRFNPWDRSREWWQLLKYLSKATISNLEVFLRRTFKTFLKLFFQCFETFMAIIN